MRGTSLCQFHKRIFKRTWIHNSHMKTKNWPYSQGIMRGFSAPSPHVFRTFSARSPLIYAEKVWRRCGNGAEKGVSIY